MNGNDWIDIPVIETMEYFSEILATAYTWAHRYAVFFGLIGLIWSCIKLLNSRMTVKDLWWDTIFKWAGFLILISLYPSLTVAFSKIGNEIGMKAGPGKAAIESGLSDLRNTITKDVQAQKTWAAGLTAELKSNFENLDITPNFADSESYNDFLNKIEEDVSKMKFDSRSDKKKARNLIDRYREKSKHQILFSGKILAAIDSVVSQRTVDGEEEVDLTDSYVKLDIWLKTSDGKDSFYLSPSALLRIALLNCQIMFEKENQFFAVQLDEISEDPDRNMIQRFGANIQQRLSRIPQILMVFFCCVVLILATIFAELQYIMTIIEYTIVVGIGAIFLPLMLFDGTKDIPKKLIPVFTSFMVKMIVITICLMFVYYLMIESTINTIADGGGMNWVTVADVLFNSILAYVLTQNAPKIAQTILTGQPQLSMGEAVAAAGTAAATAGALHGGAKNLARGAYNKGSSMVGGAQKLGSAAAAGYNGLKESAPNATKGQQFKAGLKAVGATAGADLKERVKAKGEAFAKGHNSNPMMDKVKQTLGMGNGAGGSGSGGGGGSGVSAHGVTGQGTTKDSDGNITGETYSTTSNASFNGATRYDEKTGQQRSMTHKEFNAEKRLQGAVIGQDVALNMASKMEEKEKENKKQGSGSGEALGDSLGVGERKNE